MSPAQRLSLASAATASSSVNRGNVHSGDEDEDEDGDDMFCESQGDIASFMGQQDVRFLTLNKLVADSWTLCSLLQCLILSFASSSSFRSAVWYSR